MQTVCGADKSRSVPKGLSLPGAGLIAVGLLLLSGGANRFAAQYLSGVEATVRLPRGTLAALPLRLGEWTGRDVPLDDRVIQATDTDDHVHRVYVREDGGPAVTLFLAYGVRMRDLLPHRPEVCYPSAGWTFEGSRALTFTASDGTSIPATLLRFRRGALDTDRMTVLNYYIIDGKPWADVSLLRSKAWGGRGETAYTAQVQIACGQPFLRDAEEAILALARSMDAAIRSLLADVVARAGSVPMNSPE
jgi:EpsI family protein